MKKISTLIITGIVLGLLITGVAIALQIGTHGFHVSHGLNMGSPSINISVQNNPDGESITFGGESVTMGGETATW